MKKPRSGRSRTLSISIDAATEKILKEEAKANFGGNVSRLVCAIAHEARRKAAVDRIAEWSGYAGLSSAERDAIEAGIQKEVAAKKRTKRRKAA